MLDKCMYVFIKPKKSLKYKDKKKQKLLLF